MNKVHRPWRPFVTEWQDIVSHKYAGSGTDEEPFVVDWMATDPENPFGWAHGYQWWVTILVASFTFVFTFSSSAYSGAIGSIRSEFPGYQEQTYIAGLSLYVAGFALGPLVWAPLSELYGRRVVFLLSYACFVAFNGGVIACQNIWSLAIVRFFAGAFGSSVLSNSSGTISDLFPAKRRGLGISLFASAPFMGPSIGPFIGGFLGEAGGWRWVAALIAMLSGLAWILGFFCMPETYSPVLLKKRAVKLFEATGNIYRSRYEAKEVISGRKIFRKSLIRPWKLLFSEPIVFLLSLYLAIVYGTLYLLFSAFPVVYSEQRGWSAGLTGLSFLGLMVGFLLALLFTVFIENPRYTRFLHQNGGSAPPEQRLIPACIGSVALPAGLFWFAWTAAPVEIHWIVSILAGVPFGFGMVLVFLSVLLYLIDSYLIYAASVSAANSVLRSLFGFAFPLFAANMYHDLGINWASSLIACLSLACTPLPFLFLRYGAQIRSYCKYSKKVAELMASPPTIGQLDRDSVSSASLPDDSL